MLKIAIKKNKKNTSPIWETKWGFYYKSTGHLQSRIALVDIQLPQLKAQVQMKLIEKVMATNVMIKRRPKVNPDTVCWKINQIESTVSKLAHSSSREFQGYVGSSDLSYLDQELENIYQKKLGNGKEPKSIASSSSTSALIKDRTRLHGRNHLIRKERQRPF